MRKGIVTVTESAEFQSLSLAVIIGTTLTLIIYNYGDPESKTQYNQILDKINNYSTYFYLGEFCL